jgi:hypothetical protein
MIAYEISKNARILFVGINPHPGSASHTWFVLKYLLGLPNVKSYDGSWTEYGSIVGAPIEK